MKLRGKFFKNLMRLTILYHSECWMVGKKIVEMSVAEMKMPEWINGVMREDRIKHEYIRGSIGVA